MSIKIELEFIPVSERLPDRNGYYLAAFLYSDGTRSFDVIDYLNGKFMGLNNYYGQLAHWAKLPDLSKAKEEPENDPIITVGHIGMQYHKNMEELIAKKQQADKQAAEQQRRRDMFDKVALALIHNAYGGMSSHGELSDLASRLATELLKESDKFARGE